MPANDLSDDIAIDGADQAAASRSPRRLAMPSGTRLRRIRQLPMAASLPL